MKIGKLPNEILEKIILSHITKHREEVLQGPKVGEDCAILDFDDHLCVMSTDPITGATQNIGSLSIHVACNDIASNGVAPLGVMMTILAPPAITEKELEQIMFDADQAAQSIQVEIMGGHTEITDAVNRVIISVTAVGKQRKANRPLTGMTQEGDAVIMTKYAGLEGTAVLAAEHAARLAESMDPLLLENARAMADEISVVKEGILVGRLGLANQMHDVTEGGIYGALWELAEAAGLGIEIYEEKIPLKEETKTICNLLKIDPYRLISSGAMLITVGQQQAEQLLAELSKANISAVTIGKILKEERVVRKSGKSIPLPPPDSDQLYQV